MKYCQHSANSKKDIYDLIDNKPAKPHYQAEEYVTNSR